VLERLDGGDDDAGVSGRSQPVHKGGRSGGGGGRGGASAKIQGGRTSSSGVVGGGGGGGGYANPGKVVKQEADNSDQKTKRSAEPVTHWAEVLCAADGADIAGASAGRGAGAVGLAAGAAAGAGAGARWVCVIPHTAGAERWSYSAGGASVDSPGDVAASRKAGTNGESTPLFTSSSTQCAGARHVIHRIWHPYLLSQCHTMKWQALFSCPYGQAQHPMPYVLAFRGRGLGAGAKDVTRKYAAVFSQVLTPHTAARMFAHSVSVYL